MSESKTNVVYPIIACLNEAVKFIGSNLPWNPANEMQEQLLERCYIEDVKDLEKIQDIIDSIASTDNEELMRFFRERGFEFQIDPFGPQEFGVGSVLSVLVKWVEAHKKRPVTRNGIRYEGVKAEENFLVYFSEKHEHPIVMLETQTDEKVYLTIADKSYEHLELLARVKDIDGSRIIKNKSSTYGSVTFPMVDLDHSVDISWMERISNNGWFVTKAEQKTRFKMNHIGAKAESAVRMDFCRGMSPRNEPNIIIDEPFFAWMTRPGLHDPLFVGYIAPEDWKDPGNFHGE